MVFTKHNNIKQNVPYKRQWNYSVNIMCGFASFVILSTWLQQIEVESVVGVGFWLSRIIMVYSFFQSLACWYS
jgi:hypothetical protein